MPGRVELGVLRRQQRDDARGTEQLGVVGKLRVVVDRGPRGSVFVLDDRDLAPWPRFEQLVGGGLARAIQERQSQVRVAEWRAQHRLELRKRRAA